MSYSEKITPQSPSYKLIESFAEQNDIGREKAQKLLDIINSSPYLAAQINEAFDGNHLAKIRLMTNKELKSDNSAAFSWKEKAITIRLDDLENAINLSGEKQEKSINNLVWNIGHETFHSLNLKNIQSAERYFIEQVQAKVNEPEPHSYTDLLLEMDNVHKRSEAMAEINGFNAYVSRLQKKGLEINADIIKKWLPHVIDKGIVTEHLNDSNKLKFHPEFQFSPNGMMPTGQWDAKHSSAAAEANIANMGKLFYGGHYTNDYAAGYLNKIFGAEYARRPQSSAPILLDMEKLHYRQELLERGLRPEYGGRAFRDIDSENGNAVRGEGVFDRGQPEPVRLPVSREHSHEQKPSGFSLNRHAAAMFGAGKINDANFDALPERARVLHAQIRPQTEKIFGESHPNRIGNAAMSLTALAYERGFAAADSLRAENGSLMLRGRDSSGGEAVLLADAGEAAAALRGDSMAAIRDAEQTMRQGNGFDMGM